MAAISIITIGCEPGNTGRKVFTATGLDIRLVVPNYAEDYMIRKGLDRGGTLKEAYSYARVSGFYPIEPLRPCCEEVLRAKQFDPATGTYKIWGGNITCLEFRKCFDQYVRATMKFPQDRGRMEIAPGVYAPSTSEELCIKGQFHNTGSIVEAYLLCGASDILPDWPGATQVIATALMVKPAADMYDIIKTAYMMKGEEPPPVDIPPVDIPPVHIPSKAGTSTLGLAVAGVLALVLLTR